ncbi:MAG TPA: hypothetical protein VHZ26_11430 [Caulobacteraceae bacterium]|jgi:hypothetical protein|nr:hypothetical protein [Caulobacteraceae bacterium]
MADGDPYASFGGVLREDASPLDLRFLRLAFRGTASPTFHPKLEPHQLPTGAICFEFIDSYAFNAVAFLSDNDEYVGINHGVLHIFTLFSCLFMADSAVFPTFGNEPRRQKFVGREYLSNPERFRLGECDVDEPSDPIRAQASTRLNLLAYTYLLHHELGHIAKCHIPFLVGESGVRAYHELEHSRISHEDCRIRRALELDADSAGFDLSLRLFENYMKEGAHADIRADNYIELWSASLTLLFRIMAMLELGHARSLRPSTHPSPEVRLLHGVAVVTGMAQHPEAARVDRKRVFAGMKEVDRWWKRNDLPSPVPLKLRLSTLQEEFDEVWAVGQEIQPQLHNLQIDRKNRLWSQFSTEAQRS